MPQRRSPVVALITGPLLLCGVVLAGLACHHPPGEPTAFFFLQPERIAFEDSEAWVEAERGVYHAPVNRSKPESGTVGVEVYRFRAENPGETPPVFVLHGGPGWPGLEGALERSGYYNSRILPLRAVADVVVVGQRGIGSSRPNTVCEPPPETAPDEEVTLEERETLMRETSEKCKAFWESRGVDLSGFTVVEAAADVAEIASALGYGQITLWGGSFGSHWSMAVMRFHPDLVARAVLTGLEGPDHTYDDPGAVLKALEQMAAAAEASPTLAGQIPEGGLLAAFGAVIAQADEEPIWVPLDDPESGEPQRVRFDGNDLRQMVSGYSGSARSRRRLPRWPQEMLGMINGDFTAAARDALDGGGGFPTASFFMLDCVSGITAERDARYRADPATEILGPINWFYRAACPVWGSDLGDAFRQNFDTTIPTVLVHGNWDVSTPLENALELEPFFKEGRLVVIQGGTHGALREAMEHDEGFREALAEFVRSGDASGIPETIELPPIEWQAP